MKNHHFLQILYYFHIDLVFGGSSLLGNREETYGTVTEVPVSIDSETHTSLDCRTTFQEVMYDLVSTERDRKV